jgi:endonuclease YncB( thermonuclease family)
MLLGKIITIKYSRYCPKHKSGVFLTHVIFEGNDIGEFLIKNGFAWYDEKYDIFFSKDEDKANIEMWKTARSQKLGIWKDGKASEPWDHAKKIGKTTP